MTPRTRWRLRASLLLVILVIVVAASIHEPYWPIIALFWFGCEEGTGVMTGCWNNDPSPYWMMSRGAALLALVGLLYLLCAIPRRKD